MGKGKFIVIEGLNHSGKSTQIAKLVEALKNTNIAVLANREPTQRTLGRIIRKLIDKNSLLPVLLYEAVGYLQGCGIPHNILAHIFLVKIEFIIERLKKGEALEEVDRQLLFFADRCDDIQNVIKPSLENNTWVIQDRFDLSTFVYGLSSGLEFETLRWWHSLSVQRLSLRPDLLIVIDADPEEVSRRLDSDQSGSKDIYEENLDRLKKIRANYGYLINDLGRCSIFGDNIWKVDGRLKIDEIGELIFNEVKKRFLS